MNFTNRITDGDFNVSTGPKTPAGKKRSSSNSLKHGFFAVTPVMPGEAEDSWRDFLEDVRSDREPVGAVETELVDRVAYLLWRLRRITAHEIAVAAARFSQESSADGRGTAEQLTQAEEGVKDLRSSLRQREAAFKSLKKVRGLSNRDNMSGEAAYQIILMAALSLDVSFDSLDDHFAVAVGLDVRDVEDVFEDDRWNVRRLKAGLHFIANEARVQAPEPLKDFALILSKGITSTKKNLQKQEAEIERNREDRERRQAHRRALLAVPPADEVDKIIRHEANASRQLARTMQELNQLQTARLAREARQRMHRGAPAIDVN